MSFEYTIPNLGSLRQRSRALVNRSVPWLAIVFVGCLAGVTAVFMVSSVDLNNMIPLSFVSVLEAIPLMLFLYFIGMAIVAYISRIPGRFALFTLAFVLRVIVSVVLAQLYQYDDEVQFHFTGIEQRHADSSWAPGVGYYWLISTLYSLFGSNLLLPKLVNSLWGSLLPFFVYGLAERLFNSSSVAWRAFLFAAFLPPLVMFSSVNLKEILTALLLVLTLWFLIVPRRPVMQKMLGVFVTLVTLYWLRGLPWVTVALSGPVVYFLFGNMGRLRTSRAKWIAGAVFTGVVLVVVSPYLFERVRGSLLSRTTKETYYVNRFANSSATVTGFLNRSDPLSPKNFGVLFVRGLYSPPLLRIFSGPLHLGGVIEALNMTVWYFLFPFAVVGVLIGRREFTVLACAVTAFCVLTMATAGEIAGSDPYRHRMTMMGLFSIFSAGGVVNGTLRCKRVVVSLWWTGAFLFSMLWLSLSR